MNSRMRPGRWTLADRISVALVLGAVVVGLAWRSGAIGGVHQDALGQTAGPIVAEPCGAACAPTALGISGDPATGTPYPR